MDRRTEVRFGANEPVIVSVVGKSPLKSIPGKIIGASKTGVRIVVNVALADSVWVQVKWNEGTLVGEIRYCRQILPDKYTIGLKIVGPAMPSKLKTRDLESAFE